ncbi:aromatic acid exporter family protein [Nocardia uniformis]|uniref:Aromatic acid exporter family protein n=1 Tax=Nocardia uniformis TaxID=53432 RepID=A0A849CCM7_9NOCA|nr:aromatic acid exporter family protein [Nocardia uniformis]
MTSARESSLARIQGALLRVRTSALPILQCAIAAGLAWFIAHNVIGHPQPFFAPMAAIISTGVSFGARLRRAAELMVGVAVGIGIGDVFISWVGSGVWQIALVVAVAMTLAVFLDSGTIITAQAAGSAVLVATLLPPHSGASGLRMVDALVGGVVGILVVAVLPLHPVRRARQQAADVLAVMGQSLADCGAGLLEHDAGKIKAALDAARGTQSQLDSLRNMLEGGEEIIRISPLYWNSRQRMQRLRATAEPLDHAIRNTRVLLRRALSSVRDDEVLDPRLIVEVEKLGQAVDVVRRMVLADPDEQPDAAEATRILRTVAKGATKDMVEGSGISAHVVFAQIRSIVVDLMEVCGMKRLSAVALLPPTVSNPYVTPVD